MKVVHPVEVPEGPNVHWQMDLIDMGQSKIHDNMGYQYCLTIIDIFSKYVKQLKSKEASEVVDTLETFTVFAYGKVQNKSLGRYSR